MDQNLDLVNLYPYKTKDILDPNNSTYMGNNPNVMVKIFCQSPGPSRFHCTGV